MTAWYAAIEFQATSGSLTGIVERRDNEIDLISSSSRVCQLGIMKAESRATDGRHSMQDEKTRTLLARATARAVA